MAATDIFSQLRIPVSHCHFPGVGYGKSEGERGVYEGPSSEIDKIEIDIDR